MQDKMFYKDLAFTGAKDFKSGKLGRREFLYLCALAGVATSSVIAGDAEAAANEIVLWNWGAMPSKAILVLLVPTSQKNPVFQSNTTPQDRYKEKTRKW